MEIESSTKEVNQKIEENTEVTKHIRCDIADIKTQLGHVNEKLDRQSQSEERATQTQKRSPVNPGKIALGENDSVNFCFIFVIYDLCGYILMLY